MFGQKIEDLVVCCLAQGRDMVSIIHEFSVCEYVQEGNQSVKKKTEFRFHAAETVSHVTENVYHKFYDVEAILSHS